MRIADIGVHRPRGMFRLALCCGLVAALSDCGGGIAVNGGTTASAQGMPPAAGAPPALSFSASPMSLGSGAASMLSWSSTNMTSCTASGGWSGSEPTSGSASTGALSATTTYTLTCTGSGSSASQSVTVNVNPVVAGGPSCSATSGGLVLRAKAVRSAGISPLLMFFDATGTTSSALTGNSTAFQDIFYSWSFGDTGASGSGTWAYGSEAGHNSKNAATGAVAAHLYITNGADTSYPVTVTAYDGTNSASCSLGVTAYDASGTNGFHGNQTTCVYNSTSGSSCPAGAAQLQTSSLSSALSSAFGSSKRVLFRCGDRFSGSYTIGSGVSKASIGAYGGCENSTSNRPVFQNSGGNTINFVPNNPTDIRITDIDFEDGTRTTDTIGNGGGLGETQITLYNLNCNGANSCYYMNQATQSGLIQSVATGMNGKIGSYWNYAGNNPPYSVSYNAIIGNSLDGSGAPNNGSGIETLRISACRFCVISNNTLMNANNVGAVLKNNSANTYNGYPTPWAGQYSEYEEISDNLFAGSSGGQLVEIGPANNSEDERERFIVVERNLFHGTASTVNLMVAAVNVTVRNNVFHVTAGSVSNAMRSAARGLEPSPTGIEAYNNTCYTAVTIAGCVVFASGGVVAGRAAANSFAQNNLFYNNGANSATVVNSGSGNTVTNNTANSAANPLLINASGSFGLISDFQPTQNYSGATTVPVWYDAHGMAWSPTWSLGALKP